MICVSPLRALCAAILLASTPLAARPEPAPSPSPIPQIAHVTTSDRSDEDLARTSRTTFVITKAQMLRYGYRTVADAIASLPSVNIERYGPGAFSQFGIRGSSSSQVLILVDGLPTAGSQINSLDLNEISTAGVERIELVEGGGSTLYGSGSVGGIVNIITAPLGDSIVDVRDGSNGERALLLQTPHVSFERTIANNAFGTPDGSTRQNADSQLTSAHLAFDGKIGSLAAQLTAGITDHHLGVPGSDTFFSPTSREADLSRNARLRLSHSGRMSLTTLDLGAGSLRVAFTCDPSDMNCFAPAQLLTDGRLQVSLRNVVASDRSRTILGFDLSRGFARVDDGFDPIEVHAYAQTAAYVQQDWLFAGGDRLYAGLRAERDGAQGGAFSPSLGAIVRMSPGLIVRANFATAFRAPTADDLYYPGFSNPKLVPERTRVADVTLTAPSLLDGTSLGWFSTAGTNLIVLDEKFVPQNVGHALIQGFTFETRTRPRNGIFARFNLTDLYRAQDLTTGTRLPSRGPVLQSNLELGYVGAPKASIESAAILLHTAGARASVDNTLPLFDQAVGFTRVDAFVRIRAGSGLLVTLRGFNLGNERYAEVAGYPLPGRSFALELSTR
jgi:vitamin B12 transporter